MPRVRAAVAGVVGVGVALGVAELLAGLIAGVPSLVTAVATEVIPLTPTAVQKWAIATFGTADKAVLTLGTVVIALAVGSVAGLLAREDPWRGDVLYVAFGVLGILAAATDTGTSLLATVLVVTVAVTGGILVRRRLSPAAGTPAGTADGDGSTPALVPGRRQFLATAGIAAAGAIAAGAAGRWLLWQRRPVGVDELALPRPSRAAPEVGPEQAFRGVDGLTPIVVPNGDFYRIDTVLAPPAVDPEDWTLRIHGMVEREVELTYEDLTAMGLVEGYVTLSCVSNEVGGGLVGNARWLGVPLRELLDLAGVQEGATQIVGRAVDGWTAGFPTDVAYDGRMAMVALGMNGEPLPAAHGFPARLVVPGLYGYVSATKWLSEIELTTWEAFDAYWIPRGWSKRGPIKTQSRIDVPREGERVTGPGIVVAGVAWAPHTGIARVEVRADDGPWQECELTEPLSNDAWVQFRTEIDLQRGDRVLEVRATDRDGDVQTAERTDPAPDGATGHHRVRVFAT